MDEDLIAQIEKEIDNNASYGIDKRYEYNLKTIQKYSENPEELLKAIQIFNGKVKGCFSLTGNNCGGMNCGDERCAKLCYMNMLCNLNIKEQYKASAYGKELI